MDYPFTCPNCGHKENISMRMSEYRSDGHLCNNCNTEMQRDVSSYASVLSVDKTGSFYRKYN